MKKILFLCFAIFAVVLPKGGILADTINLYWLNEDGTTYQNSTCTVGNDLEIPSTPPTKYGYTFTGWKFVNYIPIEYLESTGTQYIDTGVQIGTNVELRYKFRMTARPASGFSTVFSARKTAQINSISQGLQEGLFWYGFGNDSETSIATTVLGQDITVVQNKNNIVINGDSNSYASGYNTNFTQTASMYLFARNNIGAAVGNFFIGRIYYAKTYDNDVLIRDFIPVLDGNGTPCMYDKVTGQFFYNAGTGQFIAGPVSQ